MNEAGSGSSWRIGIAFAAVYLIWGSTYLCIRFAIESVPPFLMSGARFLIAGVILYVWAARRGTPPIRARHWRAAAVVGGFLIVGGNGLVAWAERVVPSGLTALLVAIVPLWIVLLNWLRPRGERPRAMVLWGVLVGMGGVVLLIGPDDLDAGGLVSRPGALLLAVATFSWAVGSLYSREAQLPLCPYQATAMQMIVGGAVLTVVGFALGEGPQIDVAAISRRSMLSFAYLVVFGSIIAYTAYVWLLRTVSPAAVSTYAYVNPVVALFLGWFLAGERLTPRSGLAAFVIVIAVILITAPRAPAGGRSRQRRRESSEVLYATSRPSAVRQRLCR